MKFASLFIVVLLISVNLVLSAGVQGTIEGVREVGDGFPNEDIKNEDLKVKDVEAVIDGEQGTIDFIIKKEDSFVSYQVPGEKDHRKYTNLKPDDSAFRFKDGKLIKAVFIVKGKLVEGSKDTYKLCKTGADGKQKSCSSFAEYLIGNRKYNLRHGDKLAYKNVDGKEILVEEKHYHLNGVLKMTGKLLNGKREGEWTAYFDNEQLQSSGIYKNGLRTGIAHIYFSNGKLLYQGMYKDDKETGHWKFYNKSGKLVNEKDFSLNY